MRPSMKTEMLYGIHPVREALLAGKRDFHALYISKSRKNPFKEDFLSLAKKRGILIEYPDASFFKDKGHQGIAAKVSIFKTTDLSTILSMAQKNGPPFLLLLDGINDPQNCGALVRSALCAGVHGICLPSDRSVGPTPTVSKASAGALEHMSIAKEVNLVRAIKYLKDQGVWIFGTDARASKTIWNADLSGPVAVVVGSEGKGLRKLVKKECDQLMKIPQVGVLGSLNASVAGALTMFEVLRQRKRTI